MYRVKLFCIHTPRQCNVVQDVTATRPIHTVTSLGQTVESTLLGITRQGRHARLLICLIHPREPPPVHPRPGKGTRLTRQVYFRTRHPVHILTTIM